MIEAGPGGRVATQERHQVALVEQVKLQQAEHLSHAFAQPRLELDERQA